MERRRQNRLAVELPGQIRSAEVGTRAICYGQISVRGCRVTGGVAEFGVATMVIVTLGPVGDCEGSVRWSQGDAIGVEFTEALHPAVLGYFGGFVAVMD